MYVLRIINSIRKRWRWKADWIKWWLHFVRWIHTSWLCKSNYTTLITVFLFVSTLRRCYCEKNPIGKTPTRSGRVENFSPSNLTKVYNECTQRKIENHFLFVFYLNNFYCNFNQNSSNIYLFILLPLKV